MSVLEIPSPELEFKLQRAARRVELAIPFIQDEAFGSSASADVPLDWDVHSFVETTSAPFGQPASAGEEVRQLRDAARKLGRLTNQQIARGVGVDRRSLSGWVSGEIRPTSERLEALRFLARLVEELASAREPSQVRDALLARSNGRSALEAIAERRFHEATQLAIATSELASSRVTIRRRHPEKPSRYAAAIEALRAGKLQPMTRARTVRPPSTYEVEPEDARYFAEPEREGPRRKRAR